MNGYYGTDRVKGPHLGTGFRPVRDKRSAQVWDSNGNLLQDKTGTQYTYDVANRLVKAVQGGVTYQFGYTGLGDRISQTVGSEVTTYTLDLFDGLTQVLGDGDNLYLYGLGRIGEEGGSWAYHLPDGLGSVRQLADADGEVTLARSYAPYGSPLASTGVGSSAYGFAGEWADSYMGLVFLRARYMDPAVGRFLTRDPWGGSMMRPGTLNGFSYVLGNPIRLLDPLGLCEYDPYDPYIDYDCWVLARAVCEREGGGCSEYVEWSLEDLQNYAYAHDPELDEIIEQEAARYGLPPEFIAAVIAAEVVYDTDWINSIYDAWTTCSDWAHPDYNFPPPFNWLLIPFSRLNLELWHYYYGAGPLYLNPAHGFGEGPAPGLGNIHAGVAADTEQYFSANYPGETLLPEQPHWRRLELLNRDEWNIRYVAARLRQLADIRTGSQGSHPDLTDIDMGMIFVAYHADLAYCFGTSPDPVTNFQQALSALRPDCREFVDQLGPFLDWYRQD